MKVAVIFNTKTDQVINVFGRQNKEVYNINTVKLITKALEQNGHNVRLVEGDMQIAENLQAFMPRVLSGEKMGMVFNMAYGIQGESRYTHVPALLEMLGVPYVGSDPSGHAIALDKVITKVIFEKFNIPTPKFWVFSQADEWFEDIVFPVIIKPKMEAVSYGLKVVYNKKELSEAVDFIISEFKQQALVEEFIPGREFCVGLLGNADSLEAFPVLEIDLEGDPNAIQSDEDKLYKPRTKICPAEIEPQLAEEMVRVSKLAFRSLGLKDFARVDIRLDAQWNIYILEINSMASLGKTGSYVYAASVAGYNYTQLVNKILDVGVVRYFGESLLNEEVSSKTIKPSSMSVRIRGYLRSNEIALEKILKQLVDINSHVKNVDGVNACSSIISKRMTALNFHKQFFPMIEVGNINLYTNTDSSEYDVLLLGHLDTPYTPKDHIIFSKSGTLYYGSGIAETKGGLVVMLGALQALHFARVLKKIKIAVLITTDDTLQNKYSKQYIIDTIKRSEIVLGLKPGGDNGAVVTSRSGASVYNARLTGFSVKSASERSKALRNFIQFLLSCQKLSNEKEGIMVIPTNVNIESKVIRSFINAEAHISVRFNKKEQGEEINNALHEIAQRIFKGSNKLQLDGTIRREPMIDSPAVISLYERAVEHAKKLEIRINNEHRWSSADVCFGSGNKKILDGLGPIGSNASETQEYILRNSLVDRAALVALLINDAKKK